MHQERIRFSALMADSTPLATETQTSFRPHGVDRQPHRMQESTVVGRR